MVFVLDDEVLEDVENFTASLVPVPGLFPVAVGDDMATVTIVDNDRKRNNKSISYYYVCINVG